VNADYIHTIFGYNLWAHGKVWECIQQLSDEQFVQDSDYSIGSIRNHLVHLMSVDQRWFARIEGTDVPGRLEPGEFPNRAAVRTRWDEIEARNHALVTSLNDAGLAKPITYEMRGLTYTSPTWHIIAHVVNHGTDHRAQILALLYRLGAPTIEQDMSFYLTSLT
jgi:uncharacterized damage-inducible protein DinB